MRRAIIQILARLRIRLARDRDANVTMIAAVALIPTMFGLGFSIDYARAEMLQSRINAVADAAALTGTDLVYIEQSAAVAKAASTQIFTTQVTDYADFSYAPSTQLVVTVSNQGGLNLGRTVYVGWAGQSANMFSGILGMASLSISGSSTAYATQAPYVNFFLVMDKSPSMLLPTTSTGITETQGATADTCAFACHQQFPGSYIKDVNGKTVFINQNFYSTTGATGAGTYYLIDGSNNLYNSGGTLLGAILTNVSTTANTTLTYKYASGTTKTCNIFGFNCVTTTNYTTVTIVGFYADGYWLTHNYTSIYPSGTAIDLRVSDETVAAQQLIPYAQNQAQTNSVAYQCPRALRSCCQFGFWASCSAGCSSPVWWPYSMLESSTSSAAWRASPSARHYCATLPQSAKSVGWSMPSHPSPDRRPCSPICRAIHTASPSRTGASSTSIRATSHSGSRTIAAMGKSASRS